MSEWSQRRVLVTGATGMIGANLVRRLVSLGARPHLLVRPKSSRARLSGIERSVRFVAGDLGDGGATSEALAEARPDVVFHLASTFFNPPTLSAETHFRVNALGTLHLVEALKERPEVRIVFAGSAAAYAGGARISEETPLAPTTHFGASKAAASLVGQTYARLHGLGFVELRLFSAFGPWERPGRLIPYTILSALAGEDVAIGHGAQQRDFVYVDDVVDAFLFAATRPLEGGLVVNIGAGRGQPIRDIAERILALMEHPVALKTGARKTRADEIWEVSADISRAAEYLGWRPRTGLDEALEKTIAWYGENRGLAERLT